MGYDSVPSLEKIDTTLKTGVMLGLPKFGKPQLRADNNGWARWEKVQYNAKGNFSTDGNRQFRYGPWAARLNGGEQSGGEDWASVWIPLNDIPLVDLSEIMWNYYKFEDGTAGVGVCAPNIVICTRNPDDHEERAEISQQASHGASILEGWHEDVVTRTSTGYLFWYGDNVDSDLDEGTKLYTLEKFQMDKAFSKHVVYLIKIDYGFWGGARNTGNVWIGTIQINNENIVMGPSIEEQLDMLNEKVERKLESVKGKIGAGIALRTDGVTGEASWSKEGDGNSQLRYSDWTAKLDGGAQTGGEWAAVHIPIDDLPVPDMLKLVYKYYFGTDAQAGGLHVCFATYNPADHLERAEIGIDAAKVSKDEGWNVQKIVPATDDFFWYGNNVVSDLREGLPNIYTWAEFQADKAFRNHVIYMIKLERGFWGSGDADECWVAEAQLNGVKIPIEPCLNEQLDMMRESLLRIEVLLTPAP